ncbi:response regulator [Paenibacillus sp. strain BS8-2]
MFKHWKLTIRIKIAIGYLLIICCLGVTIAIVTDRITSLQQEIEQITSRDLDIHNAITNIRYNVISMETSQRGYVITGDPSYLVPYQDGRSQWEANYNNLRDLMSDNAPALQALDNVKLTIQDWISNTAEPTILMAENNETDKIRSFFQNDPGKANIDKLRTQLEDMRMDHLGETRSYILQLESRNRIVTLSLYVMLLAVAIISLLIVAYVSGSISKTIRQVSLTIGQIAASKGDLSKRIHVRTNDEIKELAHSTNSLLVSLEAQAWVTNKVTEVATMTQGQNNLEELAKAFLIKVAPMIGAPYGVFYIRGARGTQPRMNKLAAYAESAMPNVKDTFHFGEGLVGQCAMDKRAFLLNAPADYQAGIQSGLTTLSPSSVLIVPIEFEGHVVAVVEFASLEPFTSQHLKLLESIEDHFGVAIDNVAGRMEVERLLSESQALTEELQTQTEELQAQSEELQMQQEEMRMTTEHLEEQNLFAEQKTRELEQAKHELEAYAEKLRQSAQYKTNFLANMSHELRTPLNSILILSQLLYENENKSLTDEEAGYARVIHSSGNDLLALINDILDLSKIEAGKLALVMDDVNVTEIPEMMRMNFDPVADKRGITFRIEVQHDIPDVIRTDGQRLQQILKNLLSNAFKFTEHGTVTLKIHQADPAVVAGRIPGSNPDEMIAFSVIDTGIGIPKDKHEQIFEAFQQVDGNTNRLYGGTGLGLSICNEFAGLLGGCIVVDSELHKGSTFSLYLPASHCTAYELEQAAQQTAASYSDADVERLSQEPSTDQLSRVSHNETIASSERSASKQVPDGLTEEASIFLGKRVLLVEDDERNIFAIVKALAGKGLEVEVARNGQECLDIVATDYGFDLILMDIMMPVMDGFETTRALRANANMHNTPIIALTAKAMKSDQESCLAAGASDYISKPIHMEQLFSLMRVWLTKQVGH